MQTEPRTFSVNGLVRSGLFIGIGSFFLILVQQVETNQSDQIGPTLVPSVVCILLILLGIATGVRAIFFYGAIQTTVKVDNHGFQTNLKLATVILLGFLYVWAFTAFGYLLSTFLVLLAILFIFGVRKIPHMFLYGVCGSFTYYLIFVKVMKIYDPPGLLINVQAILPF